MSEVLNILFLEDSRWDAEIIRELLVDAGYQLNMNSTALEKEYVSLLRSHKYDLIISDFRLPGFDGFAALRWSREICPDTPFICVSGTIGESMAVELLKKGAVDYVLKDKLERLPSVIQRALDQAKEKKARQQAEDFFRESERKLREERHMLRTLIDNLPAIIYIKDCEGRKVIANIADVKNIGLIQEAELLGKTDIELFPGEIGQRGYADDKTVISTGKTIVDREEDFIGPDGVRRWLLTTKIPLYTNDGKISGLVGIGHDITQRKKNETELILAKEKAEENDRLKTAFLNNISHEIRTPLNAIVGFASILATSELTPDKKKEFAAIMNTSSDQLLSMLSEILSLASLEAGQVKINEEGTDINQLLVNVYEQFLINPGSTEVTLSFHPALPDKLAFVSTDPVMLMQTLVNLVGNALKFTHKGKVRFGYTLEGNSLRFFVEDTGIGIAEDMHEHIFERFRQVDNSATRKYGGAGLGLALSKGYVELLGGSISLTSEPNKGSTFSFTLPYKPAITCSSEVIADREVSENTLPPGKTILVAEDEINNYLMIYELLTSLQLKVIRANNGVEAVNHCKEGNLPDLVLMDIKMPVMDGIEATRRIKELNPGLPVVALTAYASEGDKKRFLDSGCDYYLEKPVKHNVLTAILFKYLSQERI